MVSVQDSNPLEDDALEAGKMGTRKDLSDSDESQIAVAGRLGQGISRTAGPVGCSQHAVVSTY